MRGCKNVVRKCGAVFVEASSAVSRAEIRDLPLPEGSAVVMLICGDELVVPRGATVIAPGYHVDVLCAPADRPFVQLIFGRAEAD